jgi:nitroreductase
MNVGEALEDRRSCHAFPSRPVSSETMREILDVAPSGGNLQPWLVHVLGRDRLIEFLDIVKE